jgi:hypothetical protein
METVETLSDWRDVAGVKLPHKSDLGAGGGFTTSEYRINTGINASDLEKRP